MRAIFWLSEAIPGYLRAMLGSWRPSQAILALHQGHLEPSWNPLKRSVVFLEARAFGAAVQGRLRVPFWSPSGTIFSLKTRSKNKALLQRALEGV